MKAIVHDSYGSPDVLKLRDIDKPEVGDDDVLVRVHAASANPGDWHVIRGEPYFLRAMGSGLLKPKNRVPGVDVAGHVEAVGKKVKEFEPGDEVVGWCNGAFSEYVCGGTDRFARKPANLTFEQAAAVPVAAFTALQGLRDHGQIQSGQDVLIVGASGGVGTFAVQIAKSFGADVTGVCSTRNEDMVRSIGADRIIDYTKEDFTQSEQRFDLILDMAGTHSLSDCRRALTLKGTYVAVGAPTGRWVVGIDRLIKVFLLSPFVRQRLLGFIAEENKEDMAVLKELIEAGTVTPVIDRTYPLSEVPEAIRYLEEGHASGKIVIIM